MHHVRTLVGDCDGSNNAETICKLIADLPIDDLHEALDYYDELITLVRRIDADVNRMQTQLLEDHNAMIKKQICGAFKGYETLEQRYQRQCSHIPLNPTYFNKSCNKEKVKKAIFSEVFSAYGARADRIVDELLSLHTSEVIACLKDRSLLNAQMKRINEQINLQSQEFLVRLKADFRPLDGDRMLEEH